MKQTPQVRLEAGSPIRQPVTGSGSPDASRVWRRPGRLVALAALAAFSSIAGAACQIKALEMPVKIVGSRAVASIGINGSDIPMTVDSGAFYSFLTDATADQFNLKTKRNPSFQVWGITGRVDARTTIVDNVQLFKGDLGRVEFIVGGNEPGAGRWG